MLWHGWHRSIFIGSASWSGVIDLLVVVDIDPILLSIICFCRLFSACLMVAYGIITFSFGPRHLFIWVPNIEYDLQA